MLNFIVLKNPSTPLSLVNELHLFRKQNTPSKHSVWRFFRAIAFCVVFAVSSVNSCNAQAGFSGDVYQLSGIVINRADNEPIPLASVHVKGTYRGTAADAKGFFSLVVLAGDSIEFSAVGFKTRFYYLGDSLGGYRQSIAVYLLPDTVLLNALDVNPWPAYDKFRDAFVNLNTDTTQMPVSEWGGFHRVDNPIEPEPTIFNPASFLYEKVIVNIRNKKRKRKKSNQLPKFE